MNQRTGLFVILLLLCGSSFAQTVSKDKWWEDQHHWNGITPWINFMQLTAKYMGPNGAPVPQINDARLPEHSFAEVGIAGHTSSGDNTANAFMNIRIKAGKRAALVLYYVPYEIYKMDTITSRYTRNTRDYDGKGHASGDIYIDGYYQIAKEKAGVPDLLLSFGVRTASGTNVEAARYTDAPGYYFSLSCGRTHYFPHSFFTSIHPYVLTGAYMWQTYLDDYRQDDSFLFGVGMVAATRYFSLEEQLSGYIGYVKNGDRPIVNRLSATTQFKTALNYKLLFQYGVNDYGYKSLMLSAIMDLSKIKLRMHHKDITPFK